MKCLIMALLYCSAAGPVCAQLASLSAKQFLALGADMPLASSVFSGRTFPQQSSLDGAWQMGVAVHHYQALAGFNTRHLAIGKTHQRFTYRLYLDDQGDALYNERSHLFSSGLQLSRMAIGIGIQAHRMRIGADSQWQWHGTFGISTKLKGDWELHYAAQQLQQARASSEDGSMQPRSILVLARKQARNQLFLCYQQSLGKAPGFGLGFGYQAHEQLWLQWSAFTTWRRMSLGIQYQYLGMQFQCNALLQTMPGIWWHSAAETGWGGVVP
jgi:hypothetical protein